MNITMKVLELYSGIGGMHLALNGSNSEYLQYFQPFNINFVFQKVVLKEKL